MAQLTDKEMRKKMRPAWEIVLNALEAGQTVRLGSIGYVMEEGIVYREVWEDGIQEANIELNVFIAACKNISVDDLLIIAAQTALIDKRIK